jgi:NAD(P)-dependent dehydrogenase (short-subunit alcohol dehydrogenase family)
MSDESFSSASGQSDIPRSLNRRGSSLISNMENKVAVVTGGTSGIGQAIARRFLREGAQVIIGSIESNGHGSFEDAKGRATFITTDVSREDEVARLVALALDRHGRLDVMINNAGISGVAGGISELAGNDVRNTVDVLFNGVFYGMKHAAKPMTVNGEGTIINIASITGLATYINAAHIYSALKSAVIQLTKTVALELGPSGVRVNCICPGFIATPIFGRALGLKGAKLARSVEVVKTLFNDLQPIRRAGLPEDIANAAYWLASSEASFVTGHALVVDGGASCGVGWNPDESRFARLAAALADHET